METLSVKPEPEVDIKLPELAQVLCDGLCVVHLCPTWFSLQTDIAKLY
jgi:hypothetical protein